jgi:hypothetical protein
MFTSRSGNFSGIKVRVLMGLAFGCAALTMAKVQSQAQSTAVVASAVPRIVNFNGVLAQSAGKPSATTIGVTFLLYKDQTGGAPLWQETQNVRPDRTGHYAVMLGSTTDLPSDIFASGEARWLAVQPECSCCFWRLAAATRKLPPAEHRPELSQSLSPALRAPFRPRRRLR